MPSVIPELPLAVFKFFHGQALLDAAHHIIERREVGLVCQFDATTFDFDDEMSQAMDSPYA